jgi:hypothetical protein
MKSTVFRVPDATSEPAPSTMTTRKKKT